MYNSMGVPQNKMSSPDEGSAQGPPVEAQDSQQSATKQRPVISDTDQSGVVHVSQPPQDVSVEELRQMFSQFGTIGNIYFEPRLNDRGRRLGHKEGWVEFLNKKDAHRAAKQLNGLMMQVNKRSQPSIILCEYLHGFKWHHLKNARAFDSRTRQARIQLAFDAQKKESAFITKKIEVADKLRRRGKNSGDNAVYRRDVHQKKARTDKSQ